MRHAFAVLSCSLASAILGAAGGEAREVGLRLVRDEQPAAPQGTATVRLDRDGEGSLPFESASGELIVAFRDGKVFCDANGDGAIDATDGSGVTPPGRGCPMGAPPTLPATARIAGRDAEYPLAVLFARRGMIVLASVARLEGRIADAVVEIFDANVNGRFGEVGVDGIRVSVAGALTGGIDLVGNAPKLGRVVEVGGELFDIEVKRDGASLILAPYTGQKASLALGTEEPVVAAALVLAHAEGLVTCPVTSGDEATLPAGKYRLLRSVLVLRPPGDERPASAIAEASLRGQPTAPVLFGMGAAGQGPLTVRPGENALSVGNRMELQFTARLSRDRKTLHVGDVAIVDGLGARYRAQICAPAARSTLTVNVRADGRERELSKVECGRGSPSGAMCGLPEEYAEAKDAEVLVRFELPGVIELRGMKRLADLPVTAVSGGACAASPGRPARSAEVNAHLYAARDARREKRWADAIGSYEQAIKLLPDDAKLLNIAAWFMVTVEDEAQRRPKRAVELARRAVELTEEGSAAMLDTLAEALYQTGDLEGAVERAEAAAKLDPRPKIRERAERFRRELEERQARPPEPEIPEAGEPSVKESVPKGPVEKKPVEGDSAGVEADPAAGPTPAAETYAPVVTNGSAATDGAEGKMSWGAALIALVGLTCGVGVLVGVGRILNRRG